MNKVALTIMLVLGIGCGGETPDQSPSSGVEVTQKASYVTPELDLWSPFGNDPVTFVLGKRSDNNQVWAVWIRKSTGHCVHNIVNAGNLIEVRASAGTGNDHMYMAGDGTAYPWGGYGVQVYCNNENKWYTYNTPPNPSGKFVWMRGLAGDDTMYCWTSAGDCYAEGWEGMDYLESRGGMGWPHGTQLHGNVGNDKMVVYGYAHAYGGSNDDCLISDWSMGNNAWGDSGYDRSVNYLNPNFEAAGGSCPW